MGHYFLDIHVLTDYRCMMYRMFGKEEKEIVAYKSRMDRVLDISMKEALIQVFQNWGGGLLIVSGVSKKHHSRKFVEKVPMFAQ